MNIRLAGSEWWGKSTKRVVGILRVETVETIKGQRGGGHMKKLTFRKVTYEPKVIQLHIKTNKELKAIC